MRTCFLKSATLEDQVPKKLELSGMRFGKLLIAAASGRDRHGAYMWECLCDCGQTTIARGSQIASGATRSCGCGIAEAAARQETTHGQSGTPLYRRWRAMLDRATNPKHQDYRNYGGRGICVCEAWRSFEAFAADMGSTFDESLELDRIEVDGNYESNNCRWVTRLRQQRNKRTNHNLTYSSRTQTVQEWGEELGLKPNTIITRLRRGWSVERALSADALLEIANAVGMEPDRRVG